MKANHIEEALEAELDHRLDSDWIRQLQTLPEKTVLDRILAHPAPGQLQARGQPGELAHQQLHVVIRIQKLKTGFLNLLRSGVAWQ